jgi:hypothetical protein
MHSTLDCTCTTPVVHFLPRKVAALSFSLAVLDKWRVTYFFIEVSPAIFDRLDPPMATVLQLSI